MLHNQMKFKVCYAAFMSRQRDINQLAEGVALNITAFNTNILNVSLQDIQCVSKIKFSTNVLNVYNKIFIYGNAIVCERDVNLSLLLLADTVNRSTKRCFVCHFILVLVYRLYYNKVFVYCDQQCIITKRNFTLLCYIT